MSYVIKRIEEIAAAKGALAKKEIIRQFTDLEKKVFQYALDPYKMFGVKSFLITGVVDPFSPPGLSDKIFKVLDQLVARELTGHAAKEACTKLVELGASYDLLTRILNKDLRCGVGATTINSIFPGLVPEFKVALAEEYEEADDEWPKLGSVKYDGLRCIAIKEEDNVTLYTRNGLEIISAESIKVSLQNFPGDIVFDGELVKAGAHFQDTSGAVRKKKQQAENLEYMVFDWMTPKEFRERVSTMSQLDRCMALRELKFDTMPGVEGVSHIMLYGNKDAQEMYKAVREGRHEGLILKDINSTYQFKRSSAWTKMKDVQSADVKVTKVEEGKGKNVGKVGAIWVDFNGLPNRVGTGISDKEREAWFKDEDLIVGKIVEVAYHEQTKDGNMRHSRFIKIRFDKE